MTCTLCDKPIWAKGLCKKHSLSEWHKANPHKQSEYNKSQYIKNPVLAKIRADAWKSKNEDRVRKNKSDWYISTKERTASQRAVNVKKWAIKYPEKRAASAMKRHARKLNATPMWANEFFISEIYHLAKLRTKTTNFKWHVDHMVPLQSKLVCGLHVEYNLCVIPALDNLKKHNRYWPDMP